MYINIYTYPTDLIRSEMALRLAHRTLSPIIGPSIIAIGECAWLNTADAPDRNATPDAPGDSAVGRCPATRINCFNPVRIAI